MSAEVVYKCKDNALLDEYAAKREALEERWRNGFNQYKAALGVEGLHGIHYYDGGWFFEGYLIPNGQEPQEGWRRDSRRRGVAVPAKRTELGKALARELASLNLKGNTYPGVPNVLHSETVNGQGYSIFPRTEKLGGVWWLTLSKTPRQAGADRIDPETWEPAKLSEYHAAREANQP